MLKACVGASDGPTALEVLRRQAAEPKKLELQKWSSPASAGGKGGKRKLSGGPPDRRCWCLAAEALGRAGMVEEVRHPSVNCFFYCMMNLHLCRFLTLVVVFGCCSRLDRRRCITCQQNPLHLCVISCTSSLMASTLFVEPRGAIELHLSPPPRPPTSKRKYNPNVGGYTSRSGKCPLPRKGDA